MVRAGGDQDASHASLSRRPRAAPAALLRLAIPIRESTCSRQINQMNGTVNVYDVAEGGLANAVFFQRALERAFRFRAFRKWVTDRRSLDALVEALHGTVVHANQQDANVAIVLDVADATFYSSLKLMPESSSEFRIDVLAASRGAAN